MERCTGVIVEVAVTGIVKMEEDVSNDLAWGIISKYVTADSECLMTRRILFLLLTGAEDALHQSY